MRLNFSDEAIHSSSSALEVIFPNDKTRQAARLFIDWLKKRGGQATKTAVSKFALELQNGKFEVKGVPFRYSRRNFYLTVLRTLIEIGFMQKNTPVWDERLKKTVYVYMRNFFDIPQKPPSVGFWRLAYYLCRKWNNEWIA